MPAPTADPQVLKEIRRLAQNPSQVMMTQTAQYDLVAHHISKTDLCQIIVDWIDQGERVKPTILHSFPGLQGQSAYEMKPRIHGVLYYLKVALVELHQPDEYLLLISAHPDH